MAHALELWTICPAVTFGGPALTHVSDYAETQLLFSCAHSSHQTASIPVPKTSSASQTIQLSPQSLEEYNNSRTRPRDQFLYPTTTACHKLLSAYLSAHHVNFYTRRELAHVPEQIGA